MATEAPPDPRRAPEAADPEWFLRERYAGSGDRRSPVMSLYYAAKPLMPRGLQIALRRVYARRQAARSFPAWPVEPVLVERLHEHFREELRRTGAARVPFVNFWPERRRFAAVLTHDVEGPAGIENIPRVLEVERRHGFVSSWNFCAEWYPIPDEAFAAVRAAGCEIGLHGILHDGLLFSSRETFERNLPKIHSYLERWGAVGFRSPATHRNADWMPELGCLYDTSFPDTDPFEPQSGGCCSIFPYFLDDLVELPITLVQDHTLWEILRERSIDRWREKSEWIVRHHGLINVIVHPDYVVRQDRLDLYEEFLAYLATLRDGWHALPRDVAAWWRERAALAAPAGAEVGDPVDGGAGGRGATVAQAREDGGRIVFDV